MNNFDTDETINIFRDECAEILSDFDKRLDLFEQNSDVEIVTKLMRDAHSVKGSAGITGLKSVQKLAHATEDLLGQLKSGGSNSNNKEVINKIRDLVENIKEQISKPIVNEVSVEELLSVLIRTIPDIKHDISVCEKLQTLVENLRNQELPSSVKDITDLIYSILDKLKKSVSIKDNSIINILTGAVKTVSKVLCDGSGRDELMFIKQRLSVAEEMIDVYVNKASKPFKAPQKSKIEIQNILQNFQQSSIKTLRIETDKLDELCKNIEELGLIGKKTHNEFTKSMEIASVFSGKIFEFEKILANLKNYSENIEGCDCSNKFLDFIKTETANLENSLCGFQSLVSEIENISNENKMLEADFIDDYKKIRKSIKNIRNLPLGVILHMFPRMVRDIADSEQKEVEIEITGAETPVDKKVIEEIKMPLIHLLRNAVDHGIELPDDREKMGKNRAGKISLSAKNTAENLIICVKDDGCGVNFDKIKEKAENIYTKKDMKSLQKDDYLNMIFKAGFSTEDEITEISGRGIGLNIVYTKIEELNGTIKINTDEGKGTEVVMQIPFMPVFSLNLDVERTSPDNNKKIFVLDDSKTTIMYFKNLLSKQGYSVTISDNPKEALNQLKNERFDLLISDIEMPHLNGAELVSKLKRCEETKDLPVLIISMLNMDRARELFKDTAVDALLSKSELDEKNVLATVKQILKNKA